MKRVGEFLAIAWVCGLGSGLIPKLLRLPGIGGATFGSFTAFFIVLLMIRFFPFPLLALLILSFIHLIGAALLIKRVEKLLGPQPDPKGRMRTHDQNQIVIDEWIAVFLMSSGVLLGFAWFRFDSSLLFWALLIGTVLFRVIDILKPWPLDRLEKLDGWKGVVADDIVGGIVCVPISLLTIFLLMRL